MGNEVAKAGSSAVAAMLREENVQTRFNQILGKRTNAFMSSIISAVSRNKQLQECDPASIVAAGAIAATLDLPIDPSLGMAHIVPYGGFAQFQVGWKGFVQLAMRSGQYQTINFAEVYEGQIKNHNQFTGDMEFQAERTGDKVVGHLLYFRLHNGFEKYFYMTQEQCEKHGKKYSKSYQAKKGMWVEDFDKMAKKTVVKLGLSQYGILSVEMQTAFAADQALVNEDGSYKYLDNEEGPAAPKAIRRGRGPARQLPQPEDSAQTQTAADVIGKIEVLLVDRPAGVQRAFRKYNIIESEWKKANPETLAAVLAECGPKEQA